MAKGSDRKLYLGPRLRVLRRDLGLSQTDMAEELGVSPSYLNHLERNQRPMTAQMLLRLADTYDIDMRDFASGSTDAAISSLSEIFSDPLVRDVEVSRQEIIDIAENYPGVGELIHRFYRAITDLRGESDLIERASQVRPNVPVDLLREYLQQHHNHFPALDEAMEALAAQLPDDRAELHLAIRQRLADRHNVSVRIVPARVLDGGLRQYDLHRRRLMISEMQPPESRMFAMAYQLASMEAASPISEICDQARFDSDEARALLRVALSGYAAAALLMPYGRFHAAARECRYDLPLLRARFGLSFEQLFHRLTTLGRNGGRGIPFFLVKIDSAGNVVKRFASDFFPFALFGGSCPRWNLHASFRAPGSLECQSVEMPDGKRYFTMALAFVPPGGMSGRPFAIALGCEARFMGDIIHADAFAADEPVAIGPSCHLCPRPRCPDRATPPVNRGLELNPNRRDLALYPFRTV